VIHRDRPSVWGEGPWLNRISATLMLAWEFLRAPILLPFKGNRLNGAAQPRAAPDAGRVARAPQPPRGSANVGQTKSAFQNQRRELATTVGTEDTEGKTLREQGFSSVSSASSVVDSLILQRALSRKPETNWRFANLDEGAW